MHPIPVADVRIQNKITFGMNKLHKSIAADAPASPPMRAIPYFVDLTRTYPVASPIKAQTIMTTHASHYFVLCFKNREYIKNDKKNVTNIVVMINIVGLINFLP